MAKKRVLSFQTPRKKVNTPLRAARKPETEPPAPAESLETLENKLIEAYRGENAYLRHLKGDALLYNKLLGITITEDENKMNFTIERGSTTGHKRLQFNLEEKETVYLFSLKDSVNCNVPEYFHDVIEFDKKAFPFIFCKAMQAVYEAHHVSE